MFRQKFSSIWISTLIVFSFIVLVDRRILKSDCVQTKNSLLLSSRQICNWNQYVDLEANEKATFEGN